MKICVLTHYTPSWKELAEITIPILEKYCQRHNYKLDVYPCNDYQRYTGKEKILQALHSLDDGDIGLILDADCLITNLGISLHNFIDADHDFFITKHVGNINAGVFIVRKTEWLKKFLNYTLAEIGKEGIHCEQDALIRWMKEHPKETKIKIVNHPAFNSLKYELYPEHGIQEEENGQWIEGKSFILHLPGISMNRRLEILKNTSVIL